jgi:hypothetical protein
MAEGFFFKEEMEVKLVMVGLSISGYIFSISINGEELNREL